MRSSDVAIRALALLAIVSMPVLALAAPTRTSGSAVSPAGATALADTLFAHRDWKGAADAYRRSTRSNPGDARLWSRLAASAHAAGDYREASAAWARADSLLPSPVYRYNLACSRALGHEPARAMEALRGAIALGFVRVNAIASDPDLASLHDQPEWTAVLDEARAASRPCERDPAFRGLDFWVGDWNVFTAQGQPAGSSRIERLDADCAIFEHWQGALGDSGISLNTRDAVEGAWRQLWVDQRGKVSMFTGQVRDGAMHYEGYRQGPKGERIPARMTLTPLSTDEVRQLGENSSDGGVTWTTSYDFTYRRRR